MYDAPTHHFCTPYIITNAHSQCNQTFILRFETVVTEKTSTRSKAQKQHLVFQHYLYADDEKLTGNDFKIYLIDSNEGFVAPARNISISELHSRITFCTELVNDALNSCKKVVSMTPQNSQINTAFVLAKKYLRAALDLRGSANVAMRTANVTVQDVSSGIPGPSTATVTSETVKTSVVSTGQRKPQGQGGVATAGAEGGAAEGDTQPQGGNPDPEKLQEIPDEELKGLEDVDDPDKQSKFQSLYTNIVADLHWAQ